MPTIRFLARTIDAIKAPKEGRIEYWDKDTPGFGLRVSESGRKTWVVMYRHQKRLRRLTLGSHPPLSLADAREMAKDELRAAAKGEDPASRKKAERNAQTFGQLADLYMEKYAKPKKRSWFKDQQAIDNHLKPAFGSRKAASIKRREVVEFLEGIRDKGAPIQANRTLEIMRRIYNWGIEREILEVNPCARAAPVAREKPREKVLSDDEIRAVWKAFEEETVSMGTMFKLRLLTAQRGGEICRMRRSDIDLDAGWWTIPGEHSKNGLAHRVPLTERAIETLNEALEVAGSSEWVFPSPKGKGPIWSIWKATARIRENSGVAFKPHDLRRTAASRMTGDLVINRLVVSKILNHVESGVTSIYDRHSYDAEKRHALQAWGQRLTAILAAQSKPENVIPLISAG